jgi:hypothetical protein
MEKELLNLIDPQMKLELLHDELNNQYNDLMNKINNKKESSIIQQDVTQENIAHESITQNITKENIAHKSTVVQDTAYESTVVQDTAYESTVVQDTAHESTVLQDATQNESLNDEKKQYYETINKMFDIVEVDILKYIYELTKYYDDFKNKNLVYSDIFNCSHYSELKQEPLLLQPTHDLCDKNNFIKIKLSLENNDWNNYKSKLNEYIPDYKENIKYKDHYYIQQSIDFLRSAIYYVWQSIVETTINNNELKVFLNNILMELDNNTISFIPIYISQIRREIEYLKEVLENIDYKLSTNIPENELEKLKEFKESTKKELDILLNKYTKEELDTISKNDMDITNALLKLPRLVIDYSIITREEFSKYFNF